MSRLLTVKEVAGILGCHPHHLYRLIGEKRIRFFKIPHIGIRFDPEDIKKMIENSEIKPVDWEKRVQEWHNQESNRS